MPIMSSFLAVLLTIIYGNSVVDAQTKKRPNFFFILADDLGFANVGYHNNDPQSGVKTPNIDSLVENGLELNRHYVHYVCSPTRSSIQSGRLPVHNNLSNSAARQNVYNGVPPNYTCMAERLLNDGKYQTHFVGKWDSGSTVMEQTPYGRGYQTSFGYLNHMNDYWYEGDGLCGDTYIIDLWDTNQPANTYNNTKYEEFLFAEQVYKHIDDVANNPNDPFLIFYAAHIAHSPVQIPKEYLYNFGNDENLCMNYNWDGFNRSNCPVYPGFNVSNPNNWNCRSIYQSMVNLLDEIIGNITTMLKEKNLWNDTLIVFSADNGGELTLSETAANNYPLRGGKFVPFEGGIRVNAFVSGGYLPSNRRGQIENGLIHVTDWYSTFLNLAGLDPTDQRAAKAKLPPIDSMDLWPLISGSNATSPRIEIPVDQHTLIQANYKFYNETKIQYAGWSGLVFPNSTSPHNQIQPLTLNCMNGCLFDILKDPTEHVNIINQNTEVASKMNQRLNELKKGYYTNDEKGVKICPANITQSCQCWAALNVYGGFWGPSQKLT